MKLKHRSFLPTELEFLFGQVGGICPVCSAPLTYNKDRKLFKQYQIAHIYPLNPTPIEISLLENEEVLVDDVDSLDNLILLCPNCHTKFDKPRTVEEYRDLVAIKKRLIHSQKIRGLYSSYTIEDDIRSIIGILTTQGLDIESIPLEYSVIRVDDKLTSDFDQILRRHIKDDIINYYTYIKSQFRHIEEVTPGKFDLIAGQIKAFYLNAKMNSDDQVIIFNQISEWIQTRVGNCNLDACKVIVAFFIQNCEVFEYVAK